MAVQEEKQTASWALSSTRDIMIQITLTHLPRLTKSATGALRTVARNQCGACKKMHQQNQVCKMETGERGKRPSKR